MEDKFRNLRNPSERGINSQNSNQDNDMGGFVDEKGYRDLLSITAVRLRLEQWAGYQENRLNSQPAKAYTPEDRVADAIYESRRSLWVSHRTEKGGPYHLGISDSQILQALENLQALEKAQGGKKYIFF